MSYRIDTPPNEDVQLYAERSEDISDEPRHRHLGERATHLSGYEVADLLGEQIERLRNTTETALALIAVFPHSQGIERRTVRTQFFTEFSLPLYQAFKEYIAHGSPKGNFVELIAGQDPERQRLISWQLRAAIALDSFQNYLEEQGIEYREPNEEEIGSGANIVVEEFPVRCDMVPVATTADTKKYDIRPSVGMRCITVGIPYKSGLPTQGIIQPVTSGAHAQGLATIRKTHAIRTRIAAQQAVPSVTQTPRPITHVAHPSTPTSSEQRLLKRIERAKVALEQKEARTRNEEKARLARARVPTMFEREDVVMSLPGHFIGRHSTPENTPSFRGEELVRTIFDEAKLWGPADSQADNREFIRKRIMQTISADEPPYMNALRRLAATICLPSSKNAYDLSGFVRSFDNTLSVSELYDFVLTIRERSQVKSSASDAADYAQATLATLYGLGLEQSVEKLARMSGYEVITAAEFSDELGINVDAIGIDLLIDGVPFDIKSSHRDALAHTQKYARASSRFHVVKFVPPLTDADFDGRLVLPDQNAGRLLATTDFCQMIDKAVEQYLHIGDSADDSARETTPPIHENTLRKAAYDELDRLTLDAIHYWRER
ncbi:MAG: hypothetical protein WBP22_05595 [Candidatus Saccharimonas sp.]